MYKQGSKSKSLVVIGGGIAGVSCAQELSRLDPDAKVILISDSKTIVGASSIFRITEHLDEVTVFERSTDKFSTDNPNITILTGRVVQVDYKSQILFVLLVELQQEVRYDKLCICTGAKPRVLLDHPNIIGLRDQNSVEDLIRRLQSARKLIVVGNGGIALELIHELTFCDVDWIVKSAYVGSAFFDASSSAFILPNLHRRATPAPNSNCKAAANNTTTVSTLLTSLNSMDSVEKYDCSDAVGAALGPEWVAKTSAAAFLSAHQQLHQNSEMVDHADKNNDGKLKIHFAQEVNSISEDGGITWKNVINDSDASATYSISPPRETALGEFPLYIRTTTGEVLGCDFVVSATGVQPQNEAFTISSTSVELLQCDGEGYICVDSSMHTNIPNVFAAGDCCLLPTTFSSNFFQMRLWSQAHWMGIYAAQSMVDRIDDFGMDAKFELFTHITRFFGYKVVMLGRFNAQGLGSEVEAVTKSMVVTKDSVCYENNSTSSGIALSTTRGANSRTSNPLEIWVRIAPEKEYIKLTVFRGKLVGALLIGDTDLEEVFENLILNALDISGIGIGLLDPEIDISDYFD